MKLTQKFLSVALAVMMIVSVVIIPASAASSLWQNEFAKFPELYDGSYAAGYIRMLQRFLYGYSNSTKSSIVAGGGIDGGFGGYTTAAVKSFQGNFADLSNDGRPGAKTWTKIAAVLLDGEANYLKVRNVNTYGKMAVVYYKQVGTATSLYTFNEDGTQFQSSFHSAKFT